MKKISIILIVISVAFLSCEFDKDFDQLNVNPTASSNLDINPKFAYLFLKTAGEEYEVSFTEILMAGQLVQQVVDQTFPQGSIFSMREDLNHAWWDTQYQTTIKSVIDIIAQLASDGNTGTEMGIARIWKVFIFHKLADVYGETPYFDAGRGYLDANFRPKYDTVEAIYMDMLKELEEAVAQIGSSSTLGASDLVFNGDTAKWKRFANSLMLRLAMRIKNVDASTSAAWASKAVNGGTMLADDDTAYMIHTDGPTDLNRNAWGTYAPRYPRARIGKTIYDWLDNHSDPRLSILADPAGPAAGNPYGFNDSDLSATGASVDDFAKVNPMLTKKDSPRMFLTYAQTALLTAEYYAASGDHATAEQHYNSGVKSAMQQWNMYDSSLSVSDAAVTAYLTANPYSAATAEEMIGEQFWAASFFDFFEAFSNWRRTGYPALQPFGGNAPHPTNITNGTIPRRLIVNPNEASVNSESFNAMTSSQGANTWTTRVWWDVN